MTEDSMTYPIDGSGDTYGSGSATEYTEIGIMLAAQDVTPTGLTLVCSRDGGFTDAEIISGSWYTVEQREGDTWAELPYLLDNVGWTEEGWIIAPDTSTEWAVDWEWLYGELSAGEYRIGKEIVLSLFAADGIDLQGVYDDCGTMIYDLLRQDVHAGGSGCGCSASVLCGYLMQKLEEKPLRLLFCGTGALLSPTSVQQGESIPAVCHAVSIFSKEAL